MGPNNLHGLAVTAEGALEKLATALGEAGAPPETVQGVTQMAEVLREVVKALGEPMAEEEAAMAAPAPEATDPAQPATIGEAVDSMGA